MRSKKALEVWRGKGALIDCPRSWCRGTARYIGRVPHYDGWVTYFNTTPMPGGDGHDAGVGDEETVGIWATAVRIGQRHRAFYRYGLLVNPIEIYKRG